MRPGRQETSPWSGPERLQHMSSRALVENTLGSLSPGGPFPAWPHVMSHAYLAPLDSFRMIWFFKS